MKKNGKENIGEPWNPGTRRHVVVCQMTLSGGAAWVTGVQQRSRHRGSEATKEVAELLQSYHKDVLRENTS